MKKEGKQLLDKVMRKEGDEPPPPTAQLVLPRDIAKAPQLEFVMQYNLDPPK
jgi:hypothetical protein